MCSYLTQIIVMRREELSRVVRFIWIKMYDLYSKYLLFIPWTTLSAVPCLNELQQRQTLFVCYEWVVAHEILVDSGSSLSKQITTSLIISTWCCECCENDLSHDRDRFWTSVCSLKAEKLGNVVAFWKRWMLILFSLRSWQNYVKWSSAVDCRGSTKAR